MANGNSEGQKRSYVESKKAKKKSAMGAAWILILLALIFVFVLIKFARNAGLDFLSTGLPSSADAYTVAKDFVKTTVRASNIDFPDSEVKMGKKTDSIYVISTPVTLTGDSGDKRSTKYKLVMQYKGGKQDETKNWSLLNISEQ